MIIFILGSGRSGTHFIGRHISANPEVNASIEGDKSFDLSVRLATDQTASKTELSELIGHYKKITDKLFLEKSHPNLWIADSLAKAIPDSKFVAIIRDPRAVAASTLKHAGVAGWLDRPWGDDRLAAFLGRDRTKQKTYGEMNTVERSTLRWIAHAEKTYELVEVLKERLFIVDYDNFINQIDSENKNLENFLDIDLSAGINKVDSTPLKKWRKQLTSSQITQIEDTVSAYSNPEYLARNISYFN